MTIKDKMTTTIFFHCSVLVSLLPLLVVKLLVYIWMEKYSLLIFLYCSTRYDLQGSYSVWNSFHSPLIVWMRKGNTWFYCKTCQADGLKFTATISASVTLSCTYEICHGSQKLGERVLLTHLLTVTEPLVCYVL